MVVLDINSRAAGERIREGRFNVAIGFFNFKNNSQREPSTKKMGHISIVMHAASAHKKKQAGVYGASRLYTTPRATARSSKKTKPPRNQTCVEWNVVAKARQE